MKTILKKSLILSVLVVTSISLFSQNVAEYKTVSVPHTTVTITVPSDFNLIKGQPSFLHQATASTLQVKEVSTPYKVVVGTLSPESMAKNNEVWVGSEDAVMNTGLEAKWFFSTFNLTAENSSQAVPYERVMLLTGNESKTIWLIGNYPKSVASQMKDVIKKAMLTAMFQ